MTRLFSFGNHVSIALFLSPSTSVCHEDEKAKKKKKKLEKKRRKRKARKSNRKNAEDVEEGEGYEHDDDTDNDDDDDDETRYQGGAKRRETIPPTPTTVISEGSELSLPPLQEERSRSLFGDTLSSSFSTSEGTGGGDKSEGGEKE